jgi:hypothetical protein
MCRSIQASGNSRYGQELCFREEAGVKKGKLIFREKLQSRLRPATPEKAQARSGGDLWGEWDFEVSFFSLYFSSGRTSMVNSGFRYGYSGLIR